MEHDPLCSRGNAVMALVEARHASENRIVVVRHTGCSDRGTIDEELLDRGNWAEDVFRGPPVSYGDGQVDCRLFHRRSTASQTALC